YFGLISFVLGGELASVPDDNYEPATPPDGTKHVKVLAWDLDNTLWQGILLEDGENRLQLRPGVTDVIRKLDRRGIVNTIVSKNDPETAMAVLERFGLAE